MKRYLEYEKFRNIGIKENEKLIINNSMEPGKMGNLVIVVGANNSGKSNVLDGLNKFYELNLNERDITTLSFEDKDRIPKLKLVSKDAEDSFIVELEYGKKDYKLTYPNGFLSNYCIDTVENNKELCEFIKNLYKNYNYNTPNEIEEALKLLNDTNNITISNKKAEKYIIATIKNIHEYSNRNGYYGGNYYYHIYREIIENKTEYKVINYALNNKGNSEIEQFNNKYMDYYNVNILPKIYNYKEELIKSSDLEVVPSEIDNNKFFKTVFSIIGVSVNDVKNAYSDFNRLKNRGVLETFSKKYNNKLKELSEKFNKIYKMESEAYSFKLVFESNKIFFEMFRSDVAINLDYQSTGFRWFFNFYFNLIALNTLDAGDIVIMDEPATNLHPYGQIELREVMKDFAIKNDITIIIATHSPFLIDMDYLDEIRVVSMNENESSIKNDFSTIDADDPDSLKPIKQALTVGNHILYDPDKKVVFVEGITDYNYLIAFKNLLGVNDIIFLPIEGIGKYGTSQFKEKQKELSERLIKIKKHNPILLVDNDGTGRSMKKINEKDSELEVVCLSDVNESFTEIESLFDEVDLKQFGIKRNGKIIKHSSDSSLFKTYLVPTDELSETTINNFKSLLEYLENL